eukprot:scaffold352963_cov47-Prasinocladus_malaysianus.AAC.1
MSSDERQPLASLNTLSVEEGYALDTSSIKRKSDVLDIANKYAGLVVCISAAIVVVCAFSGVGMIASMHSKITPQAVATAAANGMLGSLYGKHSSNPFQDLFILGDPSSSIFETLSMAMRLDWAPSAREVAKKFEHHAKVYQGVALDLAKDLQTDQPYSMDVFSLIMAEVPYTVADVAAFMKTMASVMDMVANLGSPKPEDVVKPSELPSLGPLFDVYGNALGIAVIEDSDGHATLPLIQWLQNVLDPESMMHMAESCEDLLARKPGSDGMHVSVFSSTMVDQFNQCQMPMPFQYEEVSGMSSMMGDWSDFTCSQLDASGLCMCEEQLAFPDMSESMEKAMKICGKIKTLLAENLAEP